MSDMNAREQELQRLFRRINRMHGGFDDEPEREALFERREALCFRLALARRENASVPLSLLTEARALADAVDAFNGWVASRETCPSRRIGERRESFSVRDILTVAQPRG